MLEVKKQAFQLTIQYPHIFRHDYGVEAENVMLYMGHNN